MHKHIARHHWMGMSAVTVALSLAVVAGPLLPEKPNVPREVLSLAGLETVKLEVAPFPRPLLDAGILPGEVERRWQERLGEENIEVTTDPNDPTLKLRIDLVTDVSLPSAVVALIFITLEQDVHLKRLDRDIVLPTFTNYLVSLDTRERTMETMPTGIERVLEKFITMINRSTAYDE